MREAVQSATRIKLDVQLNYYFKLNFFLVAGRFCHMPQCGMHSIALHVFEYKLDVQHNYHCKLSIRSRKTFFPYAIMREAVQSATRMKLDVQLNYYFKLNFFLAA